jgi:2-methylisocitrate lyase-like PEP mutase family enzyme
MRKLDWSARAAAFRDLHAPGRFLLLGNAWDVGSAVILARLGYGAVGTTSAGIAFSRGVPDFGLVSLSEQISIVREMVSSVDIPVTFDLESASDLDGDDLALLIGQVVDAGAVGVNIEDSIAGEQLRRTDIKRQMQRLRTIRDAANQRGAKLFVNARVDSFWCNPEAAEAEFEDLTHRSLSYLEAGADGIFAPGLAQRDFIQELVRSVPAPINVLLMPGGPDLGELKALGIRRVSQGSSLARAAYSEFYFSAQELLEGVPVGSGERRQSMSYTQMNRLFI